MLRSQTQLERMKRFNQYHFSSSFSYQTEAAYFTVLSLSLYLVKRTPFFICSSVSPYRGHKGKGEKRKTERKKRKILEMGDELPQGFSPVPSKRYQYFVTSILLCKIWNSMQLLLKKPEFQRKLPTDLIILRFLHYENLERRSSM